MEAVMSLPHKYKEVVLLYYYQGLNLMEISEALGVAASTISIRLKKAREKLRRDPIKAMRFAIDGVRRVYIEGASLSMIASDFIPMLIVAAVTMPLAAWMFRHKLG